MTNTLHAMLSKLSGFDIQMTVDPENSGYLFEFAKYVSEISDYIIYSRFITWDELENATILETIFTEIHNMIEQIHKETITELQEYERTNNTEAVGTNSSINGVDMGTDESGEDFSSFFPSPSDSVHND